MTQWTEEDEGSEEPAPNDPADASWVMPTLTPPQADARRADGRNGATLEEPLGAANDGLKERQALGAQPATSGGAGRPGGPLAANEGGSGVNVIELCAGVGGVHEGVKLFESATGVKARVVLAVENDLATAAAYRDLHGGTPVLCKSIQNSYVVQQLKQEEPKVVWVTAPCSDFSPAGERVEGEAAECTVQAAEVVAAVKAPLALFENVPAMLRAKAWRKAEGILHKAGYTLLITKFRGTDVGGGSSRLRVYVVAMATYAYTQERCERIAAFLNARIQNSVPKCVADVLPDAAATFYWDPRSHAAPGVLSSRMPMPSPVSRHPGRAPAPNYRARERDAGPVGEAMVLSDQQVATLLGFERTLPHANKSLRRKWVAGLIQPKAVCMLMECVNAAAPLQSDWVAPPDQSDERFKAGITIMHDQHAPPPEWLVRQTSGDAEQEPVLLTTKLRQLRLACESYVSRAAAVLLGGAMLGSNPKEPAADALLPSEHWQRSEDEDDTSDDTGEPQELGSAVAALSGAQQPTGAPRRNGFVMMGMTVYGDHGI